MNVLKEYLGEGIWLLFCLIVFCLIVRIYSLWTM